MNAYPDLMPARLAGVSLQSASAVAAVADDGHHEVGVRWTARGSIPWRCEACGPMRTPECAHAFAAALLLAESVFGLTRVPDLEPGAGRPPHTVVRVVGVNLDDGVAFVQIGDEAETRIRWQRKSRGIRWKCTAHPTLSSCIHTHAVTWHLAAAGMRKDDPTQ